METTFKLYFISILISFLCFKCKSNNKPDSDKTTNQYFEYIQLKTDTLFNSNQIINIIKLHNDSENEYQIEIGFSKTDLKVTSFFAENENVIGAINGSFFDMDFGGSVTYLELNDSVISKTRSSELKWGVSDSLINAAIIFTKNDEIEIQPRQSDQFYSISNKEQAVMVSGPLLIYNEEKTVMPDMKFVNKRHPRTCVCKTEESLLFITVDGRSPNAKGMNLYELQEFLLNLDCIDAINLDGGGSTTMWIHDKGVVNNPSDKIGQRPVANAILIKKE